MKKRLNNFWKWAIGLSICACMIGGIVAKSVFNTTVKIVGENKTFLASLMNDFYANKKIDSRIVSTAKDSVIETFNKFAKGKGKFLSLGEADTIPLASDLISHCVELSYNVPVNFEKGTVTFTIRVLNEKAGQKVMTASGTEGVLEKESFRRRVTGQLPESSYKSSPRW